MSARPCISLAAAIAATLGLPLSVAAQSPSAGAAVAEEVESAPTPDLAQNLPFYGALGKKLVAPTFTPPPPPPAAEPKWHFLLGVTGRYERLFVPSRDSQGSNYEATLYLGGRWVGFFAGAATIGGQAGVVLGASLFQFADGVALATKGTFRLSLLVPDLRFDISVYPEGPRPTLLKLGAASDLLGLRVSGCAGGTNLHFSVRGPTVGAGVLWSGDSAGKDGDFVTPLGVLVDGGFLF